MNDRWCLRVKTNLSINEVRYNRTDGILTIKTKDGTLRLNDKELVNLAGGFINSHKRLEEKADAKYYLPNLLDYQTVKGIYDKHQTYLKYICYNAMYELVLKQIYEDLRVESFYIPYDYEGLGNYSDDELAPGYKSTIYSIGDDLALSIAKEVANDIKDKGIPIGKIYPEDGELIMLVDEDKLKGDNDNE